MIAYYFPVTNYFCTAIAAGRFPFWLPGLLNGVPLYTDFQAALYYPLRWLLVLFVRDGALPVLAYQWYIVLHIVLGGLLMYGYLKSHRLQPLACGLGSLVFCLAGFSALHIIHNPMLKVYAWLPLQLWLVDKAVATRRAKYYAGVTLAILVSLCAGFPQTTLYDSYLVIAYWLYRRYRAWPVAIPRTFPALSRHLAGEAWRIAGVFGSVLLLGAILILPTFEHWQWSTRHAMEFSGAAAQSLPLRNLIQFAVPNFFGVANFTDQGANYWGADRGAAALGQLGDGPHCYTEFGAYAGQLALIALLAVVLYRRLWRTTPVLFFALGWAVAVWFMLGEHGGLFQVLYHGLPGIAFFRSPARMAGVANCCAAVLVAFVVHAFTRPSARVLRRVLFLGLGVYAVGYCGGRLAGIYPELHTAQLAATAQAQTLWSVTLFLGIVGALAALQGRHPMRRWLGGGLLLGLTFVDLYSAYGFFHRGRIHPDQYFDTNLSVVQAHAEYVQAHGPTRFAQISDGRYGQFVVDRNLPLIESTLETSQGYFDLMLRDTALIRQLTNLTALLDLQNVGILACQTSTPRQTYGLHRPSCLPRVKFYSAVRRYDSDAALLHDLDDGTLDYQQIVAVRADELGAALPPQGAGTNSATDRVELVQQTPEHYQIRYAVKSPGIIFVSESFYPGWQVTDAANRPLPLIRAFVAFKGIVITHPGQGTLDVRFRPRSFQLGAAITGVTALALMIFYRWRSRWEWPQAPPPSHLRDDPN